MPSVAPAQPAIETEQRERHVPLYHVILHNDDLHTYEYVIVMLVKLFGKSVQQALEHAREVDRNGTTIIETCPFERAEFKRDQIVGYGPDPLIAKSTSGMLATIETAD